MIFFISFLIGSIPFGLMVARIFHVKDLSSRKNGNLGTTFVSQIAGVWPAGALTFALDVSKGAVSVFLATPVGGKVLIGRDKSMWLRVCCFVLSTHDL